MRRLVVNKTTSNTVPCFVRYGGEEDRGYLEYRNRNKGFPPCSEMNSEVERRITTITTPPQTDLG